MRRRGSSGELDCENCPFIDERESESCFDRCGYVNLFPSNLMAWRAYTIFATQFCHDFNVPLNMIFDELGVKDRLLTFRKMCIIHSELHPQKNEKGVEGVPEKTQRLLSKMEKDRNKI
ncbi:MAG: hypothetical protein ACTSPI_03330 [Candidatus Heimdallarchaeaceae archaeon]